MAKKTGNKGTKPDGFFDTPMLEGGGSDYITSASNPISYRINQLGRTPADKIDTGSRLIPRDPITTKEHMSITVPAKDIDILEKGLSPLEQMTFQFIQDTARKSSSPLIEFLSKEYAGVRGVVDSTSFRKMTLNQIQRLAVPLFRFDNKGADYSQFFHIVDHGERKGGKFKIRMSDIFFMAIQNGQYCNIPQAAYKVNLETYPHAFALIKMLYERKAINYGEPGADITSVATALKVFTSFPTVEEVRASAARSITRRIVKPFTDTVDYISENFPQMGLEFCQSRGEPLTDEQCEKYGAWDYETFKGLYLKCTFQGLPTDGLEAVKKRRKKREQKRIAAREKAAAERTEKKEEKENAK